MSRVVEVLARVFRIVLMVTVMFDAWCYQYAAACFYLLLLVWMDLPPRTDR